MLLSLALMFSGVAPQALGYLGQNCVTDADCIGDLFCCRREEVCKLPIYLCYTDADCASDYVCSVETTTATTTTEVPVETLSEETTATTTTTTEVPVETLSEETTSVEEAVCVLTVTPEPGVTQACSEVSWTITQTYTSEIVYQTVDCETI